jgi:hypothetical protein
MFKDYFHTIRRYCTLPGENDNRMMIDLYGANAGNKEYSYDMHEDMEANSQPWLKATRAWSQKAYLAPDKIKLMEYSFIVVVLPFR